MAFRSALGRQALYEIAKAIASLSSGASDALVQELEATDSMEEGTELARVLYELGPAPVPAVDYLAAFARSSDCTLVREVAEALLEIEASA